MSHCGQTQHSCQRYWQINILMKLINLFAFAAENVHQPALCPVRALDRYLEVSVS